MPNRSNSIELDLIDEYDRRIVAYRFQAKMYVLSNINLILNQFTRLIYEHISTRQRDAEQHPFEYNDIVETELSIIREYVQYIGDELLVVFNPKTGQPAVIEDAYIFTEYDVDAFEEKLTTELIQAIEIENTRRSGSYQFVKDQLMSRSKKVAGGAVSFYVGNRVLSYADRFGRLASHYDGGHAARLRIQNSFRGKMAQKGAFTQMSGKGKQFMTQLTRRKFVGGWLKNIGSNFMKGALKPVTPLSIALHVQSFGDATLKDQFSSLIASRIIDNLAEYCVKNQNYSLLINQTYLSQKR